MSDGADPGGPQVEASRSFSEHRHLLVRVAYGILGSLSDAEDVVQEAWLRWVRVDRESVHEPRSYLVKVTSRLALDRLRQNRARRESYVGPWLPEPLLTSDDVGDDAVASESISLALLVVLESLSPLERAVFLLREVFVLSHAEIADVVGRKEPAVRQLARRARDHVRTGRSRFDADHAVRRQVTERFLAACNQGDLDGLVRILAADVCLVADGGGRAPAPRRPVLGAEAVARFLLQLRARQPEAEVRVAAVNGGPGLIVADQAGPLAAVVLDVVDDVTQTVYIVSNPDKLAGLRSQRRARLR